MDSTREGRAIANKASGFQKDYKVHTSDSVLKSLSEDKARTFVLTAIEYIYAGLDVFLKYVDEPEKSAY